MATDIRQTSRKFREFWTLAKDSEVGGYHKFWLYLLGDVLGVDDVMSLISFQSPVQLKDTTKFLDAWIPETRVLIEHKARNAVRKPLGRKVERLVCGVDPERAEVGRMDGRGERMRYRMSYDGELQHRRALSREPLRPGPSCPCAAR